MTDSIAELTARLKTEYESAREAFRRGVLYAMNCGDLLNEIKAKLGYGNWEHWLKTESPVSPRTARRYQYLANNKAKLEASLPNLADLTVSAAEQLIRTRGKYQSCETVNEELRKISKGVWDKATVGLSEASEVAPEQQLAPEGFTVKGEMRTIAPQVLDMQDDVLLAEAERDLEHFQFRYEAWPQLVQGARRLRAKIARIREEAKAKAATRLRIVH